MNEHIERLREAEQRRQEEAEQRRAEEAAFVERFVFEHPKTVEVLNYLQDGRFEVYKFVTGSDDCVTVHIKPDMGIRTFTIKWPVVKKRWFSANWTGVKLQAGGFCLSLEPVFCETDDETAAALVRMITNGK